MAAKIKRCTGKCKTVFYGRNIDHGYKYSLHSAELENTPTIKDSAGVIFDPELNFGQHCKETINKAWGLLRETLYIYRRKLLFHFIRLYS